VKKSIWGSAFDTGFWHNMWWGVGQRNDKYFSDKDETGQRALDKASTWNQFFETLRSAVRCNYCSKQCSGTAHRRKGWRSCCNRLQLQPADDTTNVCICS